jgi:peptidoglycan/LPS O-acetylase OafA/YrhL
VQNPPHPRHRLPGLEALRGLAALAVALHHIGVESFAPRLPLLPQAYLAVDLFFVLSGFVIALAYEQEMRRGLSPAGFLRRRLIRLYPLFLLSLVLALLAAGLGWLLGVPLGGPFLLLAGLPAALLLLPLPLPATGHAWRPVVPLNPAAWSLSIEIWGNLFYALLLPWLKGRRLLLILGGAALALIALRLGRHNSMNIGAGWYGYEAGWARFAVGFTAGLLLCRLWQKGRVPTLCGWPLLLAAGAALVALWTGLGGGAVMELAAVLLLCPAVVLAGATIRLSGAAARLATQLGRLSYPVYILHWPMLYLAGVLLGAAEIDPRAAPVLSTLALLTLVLLTAAAAERRVDRPLRAWLGRGGMPSPQAPAFAPAAALQQAR